MGKKKISLKQQSWDSYTERSELSALEGDT